MRNPWPESTHTPPRNGAAIAARQRTVAKALDTKQLAFVAAIKAGQNGAEAAIAAGYSPKSARFAARRLRANPLVIAEIERVHTELREHTQYGLEAAVAECDEVLTMARERGDVKAMAKPLELKLRLHGLLRDKLDITVERVDINGALTDARNRVSLRPMRDLPTSIAGDAIGAQAPHVAGPIDTQSTARRRGDDGGSFFEAGIYD